MSRTEAAALVVALLALTAAKLMWPDTAAKAREKTLELIECRADYSALAEAMGRSAARGESGAELRAALSEALGIADYGGIVGAMHRAERRGE